MIETAERILFATDFLPNRMLPCDNEKGRFISVGSTSIFIFVPGVRSSGFTYSLPL